jgi:putative transposase
LQWHDYGPKCTVKTLLQVLFYAAGHLCSVFAACNQLRTAPSDQAVRDALTALCPDPAPLEQRLNRLFAAQIPKGLRKRPQRVAIDLTWVPYHGQPHQCLEEIYRGQAKSGTTHFHAYATAYIVRRGQRFTVALIRVEYGTPMVEVLKRLLHLLRQAGIRPRLLLLDRGFYSVDVIRYLYQARYPFIMPVVRRGRATDDPRGPSGTQVFAATKCSGWYTYTLTNADKQTATVLILTCTAVIGKGSADGMGAKPWSMPVGGSVPPAPPGFIKPIVCASGLRPATVNLMRPGSKPPLVTQHCDSCSSPSP